MQTYRFAASLLALLSIPALSGCQGQARTASALHAPPHFILVGDSTVTDNVGWGTGFGACLTRDATYTNAAAGGRSAKSFRDEGLWDQRVVPEQPTPDSDGQPTPPTYVLIQFGHNGQPGKGPARETDPATTYRDHLRRYIADARALGMTPVLVSSMTRRRFRDDGRIQTSLTPWADAAKAVAQDTGTAVIDLHTITLHVFEQLGPEGVLPLEPVKQPRDWTHLNAKGAALVGPMVAAELERLLPELDPYLDAEPVPAELRAPISRPMAE